MTSYKIVICLDCVIENIKVLINKTWLKIVLL